MQVGEMIRETARRYGEAPALIGEDRTVSYREFDRETDRLGNALLATGLIPGDRVGVLLPNSIEGLVVYYALAKAGLVRVQLNVREAESDHAYKLAEAGCRALVGREGDLFDVELFIGPDTLERLLHDGSDEPCDVPRAPDDLYRLAFTGGTTGRPKGVMLTMANEHAEIASFLVDLLPDIRRGDVMLHGAPVTHASGAFFLPHLLRGATNVVLTKFEASEFLHAAERFQATATFLVPTMLAMLLDDPNVNDCKAEFRRLCWGASPAAPALLDRAEAHFGQCLAQTYGQAEAPMAITCLQPNEHRRRRGSAGRPYTLAQVRVVDEEDRDVAPGQQGEIVTRGPHVMKGYWQRREATAETLRNGWLHTGDLGTVDEDRYFYLLDRRNDIIISGGFNVYPREVEDVLLSHSMIAEAAVVGLPDKTWGERVHAVVSIRGSVAPDEIVAFAQQRLAGYKRPRSAEVWEDLPKSGASKILRRTVRDRIAERGVES